MIQIKKNGEVSVSYGKEEEIDNIRIMKPDDDRLTAYSRIGERLFNHL
jgi:hypothetical protein